FPVFGRARENARRSSCQSNLKQIGLGMMQYTQDYDERFPVAYLHDTGSGTYWGWMQAMQPYLKSTQIFQCPSDSDTTVPTLFANSVNLGFVPPFHTSYVVNQYMGMSILLRRETCLVQYAALQRRKAVMPFSPWPSCPSVCMCMY
ncbi:DUF1559 domain-containing protein, partial [archaeon]